MNMPSKRKAPGRTSRRAMKQNKSYTRKDPRVSEKNGCSNIEGMPFSHTPVLDKETLSSAINDTVVLDPCAEDEKQTDHVMPSPYPETGRGILGSSDDKESLVLYSEERTSGNSILCPSGGEKQGEILGPCQSIDSEMLLFNDVVDNVLLDLEVGSILNEEGRNDLMINSEERETSTGVLTPDKTVKRLSSNGESLDWYSCSSITSCFDDCGGVNWAWEDVVQGHELIWDEKEENMLSWLWDGYNGEGES